MTVAIAATSLAATIGVLPSSAAAATPATVLGNASYGDFTDGLSASDNEVWFAIQDPNSRAKLFVSFNTTPELGSPVPALLMLGVAPVGDTAYASSNNWFYLPVPLTNGYSTSSTSISVNYPALGSVTYNPSNKTYHFVLNGGSVGTADLTLSGPPGGATLPAMWDGQTSNWTQALGTGTANGTITFPGANFTTTVTNWDAEQETQYGNYQLGGGYEAGNWYPSPHRGYEYGSAAFPDGSTTTLYVFPEKDGTTRGILTHTTAAGVTAECEPSGAGQIAESGWVNDSGGLGYPTTVTAKCSGQSITFTTSASQSSGMYTDQTIDGFASMQSIAQVSGASTAWLQEVRDVGYWGDSF